MLATPKSTLTECVLQYRTVARWVLLSLCCAPALPALAQVPTVAWSTSIYGSGGTRTKLADGDPQYAKSAIKIDSSGNVYLVGSALTTSSTYDMLTVKLDSGGNELWRRQVNGSGDGDDLARALALGDDGSVVVTGQTWNGSDSDFLTIKYSTSGTELWRAVFSGPGTLYDGGRGVAIDTFGNVFVVGASLANFGYALIKYDSNGIKQWDVLGSPGSSIQGVAVATSPLGDVYAVGRSSTGYVTAKYSGAGMKIWERFTSEFSYHSLPQALALDANENVFVTGVRYENTGVCSNYSTVKYNSLSVEAWRAETVDRVYPRCTSVATALALGSNGALYVTGYTANSSNLDFQTVKYDATGAETWRARLNGPGNGDDLGWGMAADGLDNVYVIGSSGSGGNSDLMLVKYDSQGAEKWRYTRGGSAGADDSGLAIAIGQAGGVYVAGVSEEQMQPRGIRVTKLNQTQNSTILSVDGSLIPVPSKILGVAGPPHVGENGAGNSINAWSVGTQACANSAIPVTKYWYHNLDYRGGGSADAFAMTPGQALTYRFVPFSEGSGAIGVAASNQTTFVQTFVSVSTTPCDFDTSMMNVVGPNGLCYSSMPSENSIAISVSAAAQASSSACKLIPGVEYYLNVRFARAGMVDTCQAAGAILCGGLLQVHIPSAPAITAIAPALGFIGSTLTLMGSDFSGAGVTIGGVAAPLTSLTSTQIVLTVPGGLIPGATTVVVTTAASLPAVMPFLVVERPDAPEDLIATPGKSQIVISFVPPGNATRSGVFEYVADCGNGSGTVSAPMSPITITGLVNGTPYQCVISARNIGGISTASNPVVAVPDGAAVLKLISVRSRVTHGQSGWFDLPVDITQPISGNLTIEPRVGSTERLLVFQFNNAIATVGGISTTNSLGMPIGSAISAQSGSALFIRLTDIFDGQRLFVSIAKVNGMLDTTTAIGFLRGNVSATGTVNSSDVHAIKARSGQVTNKANFQYDISASGAINAIDIAMARARSGASLH